MRLAIFSDVHGQVGRLSACLDAVARTGADELWCLGDAIDGLSARPAELTVACVRAINDVCSVKLAGNHEAWALQDQSLPDDAAVLIECWSVAAQRDGILAVHGSPHNPLMGHLSDERDVREALPRLPGWLCAHGHTHQAALWIGRSDGTVERQRRPTSQRLGRSMRAVACPGALSGPDPSWLLVDTVRRRLTWHRIDAGRTDAGAGDRRAGARRQGRDLDGGTTVQRGAPSSGSASSTIRPAGPRAEQALLLSSPRIRALISVAPGHSDRHEGASRGARGVD